MNKWVKITVASVLAVVLVFGGLLYAASWSPKWMIAYAAMNSGSDEVVKTSSNHTELAFAFPEGSGDQNSILELLNGLIISSDTFINYEKKKALLVQRLTFKTVDLQGDLATYKPVFDAVLDETNSLTIKLKIDENSMYLQIPQKLLKNQEEVWMKFEKKDFESYDPTSGPELWDSIQKLAFNQGKQIKLDTVRDFGRDASDILINTISGDYANVRSGDDSFRTLEFGVKNNEDVKQLSSEVIFNAIPAFIQLIQSNSAYRDFMIAQIKESFTSQLDLLSTSSVLNPSMDPNKPMDPNAMLYETFVTMKNDLQNKSSEPVDLTKKFTDEEVSQAFGELLTEINMSIAKPETKTEFDDSMKQMFETVTFKDLTVGMDMSWNGEVTKQHLNVAVDYKDGETVTPIQVQAFMTNQYNQEVEFEIPTETVSVSDIMSNYATIFDVEKLAAAFLSFQGESIE